MRKFSDFNKNFKKLNNNQEKKENTINNLIKNTKKFEESQKKDDNKDKALTDIAKFFSKLFESKEMAHIYHLQVKGNEGSYAAHMALASYYDGILKLIDDLIEIYQGQYDIIDGYDIIDTSNTKIKDMIEYFKEVAEFIKNERKCISIEDTHLHNIIDEVLALVYKTLYKLRFNR
jgi:hypothetical protein